MNQKKKKHNNHQAKKNFVIFLFLVFSFLISCEKAEAADASLYLSPDSGVYSIGDIFSIQAMVDSGGEPINVADGVLSFSPQFLEVVSISQDNSVFNFWSTEPDFSNARGIVEFAGGTSKSFLGTSGNIITVAFKAVANGNTQITFSSGAVLAADGKGTNILTSMKGGNYEFRPGVIIPPSQKGKESFIIPEGAPSLPEVVSYTHPSEDEWYSKADPRFSWSVPPGITGIRFEIDKSPITVPELDYPSSIEEKEFKDISDGTWYFHIRFKNQYGWGEVKHRRFLIDTEPPQSLQIRIEDEGDQTNPSPVLYFEGIDTLSGINYYEVKFGNSNFVILEEPFYRVSPQEPGFYTVIVKAIDKAKNYVISTEDLEIKPLEPPIIEDYPKRDEVGGSLSVKGTSKYPGAAVMVFIKKGDEEEMREVQTGENGAWNFVYDKELEEGVYQLWAQVKDKRGAKSTPTPKITVIVALPFLIRIGRVAIDYLTVILTLAGLVAGLVLVIFFARYKISQWRKSLKKETKEVAQSVVKAFSVLEKDIQEQIEYLDKKPGLSDSEKDIYNKLKDALNSSKETIGKEIKDVEEELK